MLQVRDFALLAVDQPGKGFLKLGASPPKLTPVVAAGYPEYLLDADSVFAQGIVNQKPESLPVKFLTHSASVGRGSAGGPVVDLCGRVVGVNTAAKNEGDPGDRAALWTTSNLAQDVSELRDFLTANGVTPTVDELPLSCSLFGPAAPAAGSANEILPRRSGSPQQPANTNK